MTFPKSRRRPSYKKRWTQPFKRDWNQLNPQIKAKAREAMRKIQNNPRKYRHLKGRYSHLHKYYLNSYRIIYKVEGQEIFFELIDRHDWVYKRLRKRFR